MNMIDARTQQPRKRVARQFVFSRDSDMYRYNINRPGLLQYQPSRGF